MERILQDFSEIGLVLNQDWLGGVELLNESPLTHDDVYRALMCSDVRESCISSATCPGNSWDLRSLKRVPRGSYLFQITSAIDISLPDIQRPRATGSSTKRMLKLTLHSGPARPVHAVELDPIPNLPDNPDAGTKIILSGSPIVSAELILLRPENVKIVGGDVPSLCAQQEADARNRSACKDPLTYRTGSRAVAGR